MELMRFLDQKVEEYRQFQHFWPFYKARLQQKEGTLPEFKVDFSTIGTEKPPKEEKEFYHLFIHFRGEEKPNKNYFTIMALGSQLMNKLSLWKLTHPNKTELLVIKHHSLTSTSFHSMLVFGVDEL